MKAQINEMPMKLLLACVVAAVILYFIMSRLKLG
jgi:hypothetical protein